MRAWNDEAKALAAPIIEAGGREVDAAALAKVNALSEKMNDWVYADDHAAGSAQGRSSAWSAAITPSPSAASRRYAEKYPGLGVLHLDAHADLRDAYEGFTWSHASIMFNVIKRSRRDEAGAGRHSRLRRGGARR